MVQLELAFQVMEESPWLLTSGWLCSSFLLAVRRLPSNPCTFAIVLPSITMALLPEWHLQMELVSLAIKESIHAFSVVFSLVIPPDECSDPWNYSSTAKLRNTVLSIIHTSLTPISLKESITAFTFLWYSFSLPENSNSRYILERQALS